MHFDFRDAGCRRRLQFQILNKGPQSRLGPFQINLNPLLAIQYPSRERVGACQAIDERTESNTRWPSLFRFYHAAVTLPPDLNHLAILDQ
jgi:hypothetical protein